MSIKALKSQLHKIGQMILNEEDEVLLIMLAACNASRRDLLEEDDFPKTAGHSLAYRFLGQSVGLFFPFSEFDSVEAEEMGCAIIEQVRRAEPSKFARQVGVMDMNPFPYPGSWIVTRASDGVGLADHAQEQYRLITESLKCA
ncbi:hypothetical protein [Pseudomonas putida]